MERLQEVLENREANYLLPFFWLKGESEEVIREEIQKVSECGIRELCLESRPHPDFLGKKWWKDLDCILEEAKKRRMRIWILDDRKFPTGFANGAFEEKYPELSKIYLAERHVDLLGPCREGASLVENFIPSDGTLLGILACPKPDGETLGVSGEGILDLTESYRDGFVYYDLPEGAYRLFVIFTTRTGGGRDHYMNLIDSRSVRVLLDEVYEKHYERYQQEFGKTIAGFFSDEPEIGNVPGYPFDCLPGQANIRLPWSQELEEKLRKIWGKEFLKKLPALWYDRGTETAAIRVSYMDAVSSLVRDCFSSQVGNWCRDHKVEYIGHVIEDDNAHARLGCSVGHYFREMEGQHMAGIDVVHHQIVPGFTERIHQWIAGDADGEFFHFGLAKLAASAAHLDPEKKNRALCEIFGNYGWAEGVSLMKWLSNHMLVRGINYFTPHAFSMSDPDRDCPPHFYARGKNPQFEVFGELMRYLNRAAHLLSAGKPVRDASVLYHGESEWSGEAFMLFQKPMRKLLEHQMDADVIPADVFSKAKVKQGQLCIETESYPALILPGCARIPETAARWIEAQEEGAIPIFCVDFLPDFDTAGRRLGEDFYRKVTLIPLEELADEIRRVSHPIVETEQYIPELRSFVVPEKDGLICMFFNESTQKEVRMNLHLTRGTYRRLTKADLWRNSSRTFEIQENTIPLHLYPGEAVFFILEEGKEPGETVPKQKEERKLETVWKVSRRRHGEQKFVPVTEIQEGECFPNMNGPSMDSRFVGTFAYEGSFNAEKKEGQFVELILKAQDTARVFLNGHDLGFVAETPGRIGITEALQDGKNILEIQVTNTLVWERRDGASTHLQIPATGLLEAPSLRIYEKEKGGR